MVRVVGIHMTEQPVALIAAQQILDLGELELGIAKECDLLVLELDGGGGALEVKARADFLGRVLHGILHFDEVGFTDGIKRRHGNTLWSNLGQTRSPVGRVRQSGRC